MESINNHYNNCSANIRPEYCLKPFAKCCLTCDMTKECDSKLYKLSMFNETNVNLKVLRCKPEQFEKQELCEFGF